MLPTASFFQDVRLSWEGWRGRAARVAHTRRGPGGECSRVKAANGSVLRTRCVGPCAGASGRPSLHQAAAAGTAVEPACVGGAGGPKEVNCAAASGASAGGMRWPGHGRTSGGNPRQHTHPWLDSRKSSASRRGPCAGHTGGAGTSCSNGWCSSTIALHQTPTRAPHGRLAASERGPCQPRYGAW